jgi:hypothetical protein
MVLRSEAEERVAQTCIVCSVGVRQAQIRNKGHDSRTGGADAREKERYHSLRRSHSRTCCRAGRRSARGIMVRRPADRCGAAHGGVAVAHDGKPGKKRVATFCINSLIKSLAVSEMWTKRQAGTNLRGSGLIHCHAERPPLAIRKKNVRHLASYKNMHVDRPWRLNMRACISESVIRETKRT